MKPAVVFPFHDPEGLMFTHLHNILPQLKHTFSCAYISITRPTLQNCQSNVHQIQADPFFRPYLLSEEIQVGKHFSSLFLHAATLSPPEQILHLCFIDRLAFILQSKYQEQFVDDLTSITKEQTPLIFQRSQKAWNTHPCNYAAIEKFATTVGEFVLGKTLDFAWCHLVMEASWLKRILLNVQSADLSMVAELVLFSEDRIKTRDVDWLEWEDPFFSSLQAGELKQTRESSLAETRKRCTYVLPMIQKILKFSAQDG